MHESNQINLLNSKDTLDSYNANPLLVQIRMEIHSLKETRNSFKKLPLNL